MRWQEAESAAVSVRAEILSYTHVTVQSCAQLLTMSVDDSARQYVCLDCSRTLTIRQSLSLNNREDCGIQ